MFHEYGDLAKTLRYRLRSATGRCGRKWSWSDDSYGKTLWRVWVAELHAAIAAVKRAPESDPEFKEVWGSRRRALESLREYRGVLDKEISAAVRNPHLGTSRALDAMGLNGDNWSYSRLTVHMPLAGRLAIHKRQRARDRREAIALARPW